MTRAGWSLTGRLSRRILASVAVTWMFALAIGLYVLWHEMDELLDETLASEAQMLLTMLAHAPTQDEPLAGLPPQSTRQSVRVTGVPGAPRNAPWPPLAADGARKLDQWHVVRVSDAETGIALELGQSTGWRWEEFRDSGRAFLALMLPLLGLVLWVVRTTTRRGLAPARSFARTMETRSADDLAPIPEAGLPRELKPILQALNGYLARIDALLQAERHFAAHAAHELRTPLAVASSQAQLLRRGEAGPEATKAIGGALDRLSATVERLLQLSRAEAGIAAARQPVDLVRICRLVMDEASPLSGGRRLIFDDGDAERAEVASDPDALAILLRNLIGNAIGHGTGDVRVRLSPGPAVEIRNRVAPGAAFRHGRFDKGPDSQGSGLGLTIAETIAGQLGARLDFAMADGAATVTLHFVTP